MVPSERDTAAARAAVEELVFRCLEAWEDDGEPALERLCAAHPDHAHALRRRISALLRNGLLPRRRGPDPGGPRAVR